MSMRRVPLKAFLDRARKVLAAPPVRRPNPLTFVIGNESADLDSLCSAILLAYFRTNTPPHGLHIPICNLRRADLALRPELGAVLQPAGLEPDDLLTLCDLPNDVLLPIQARWFLVDHNAPTGHIRDTYLTKAQPNPFVGCIDHHDDELVIPPTVTPRLISKSGSCTSLVLSHCRPMWMNLPSHPSIDAELAHLALGPILIDTTNLRAAERTTPVDVAAVDLAESKLVPCHLTTAAASATQEGFYDRTTTTTACEDGGRDRVTTTTTTREEGGYGRRVTTTTTTTSGGTGVYDRTAFFDAITALKEDIAKLSPRDVLRKDYKRWAADAEDSEDSLALGISAVMRGLPYLVSGDSRFGSTEGFLEAVRAWAREERLDVVGVMTVSKPEGVFTRELMVWAFGGAAAAAGREFARRHGERLGLERWRGGGLEVDGEGEWRGCWVQGNREFSRKQIAPMIREVMRGDAKL
ncbi:DHH phosphoesterase [Podospora conica]|nr:DHH phosphoesterase [Schizothecium conicum]